MIRITKNTTAFRFASVQDIKLQNIINGTSSRNSLWHLYEVLSQTSELSDCRWTIRDFPIQGNYQFRDPFK